MAGIKDVTLRRWVSASLAVLGLVLLLAAGCGDSGKAGGGSPPAEASPPTLGPGLSPDSGADNPIVGRVAALPTPHQAVDPTEPRDVIAIDLFPSRPGRDVAYIVGGAATVEEALEKGLELAGASPVHIAFRATADADSVRCGWRGIARTQEQREGAIRFWLGLEEDDEIPEASYLEILFTVTLDTLAPLFQETAKSNFLAIARGGLTIEYLFLTCYADYIVHEYLLGAGQNTLTVAYDRRGEARSYELYQREHDAGQLGEEPVQTQGEYESWLLEMVAEAEKTLINAGLYTILPEAWHPPLLREGFRALVQHDTHSESHNPSDHGDRYQVDGLERL